MSLFNFGKKKKEKDEVNSESLTSIYDYIKENLVDGKLPEYFSLPTVNEESGLKFAPSAVDTMVIYHKMPILDQQKVKVLSKVWNYLQKDDEDNFLKEISKYKAVDIVNEFENSVINFFRSLPNIDNDIIDRYDTYSYHLMLSNNIELVKLGLLMQNAISEPNEGVLRDTIMTLAL